MEKVVIEVEFDGTERERYELEEEVWGLKGLCGVKGVGIREGKEEES